MTPEERLQVIQECIDYIVARKPRKAEDSLKGMLKAEIVSKQTKVAETHPWRKTLCPTK